VRFWLRWLANGLALFLALYLVDSLLHERFRLEATWTAVLAAVLLGFLNSFVRPLHRARSRPRRAAMTAAITVLANALVLQLFVWTGTRVTTTGFIWVLVAAAFISLVAGLINWQVGFAGKERPRSGTRRSVNTVSTGRSGRRPARS
jgi:uncharacterized membrane protein YvlD (DUF360 family)